MSVYDERDPRSTLPTARRPAAVDTAAIAEPEVFDFSVLVPDEVTALGSKTWIVRAQNAVLAYTKARAGDRFDRAGHADEYAVILPHDSSSARVAAGEAAEIVDGKAVLIVPPGTSTVTAQSDTDIVRLFTPSPELAARARNAASYARPHPRVRLLEQWPEPVDGYRLRVYRGIADIQRDPSRFGRIFRNRAFMINFLYHYDGPRDTTALSPHDHEDFEQISLAVDGEFIHHLRTPMGKDKADWRDDQHVRVGSPSVIVIPPPVLHTSEACGPGRNQLLDIFSPPRTDFSDRGWVINAEEYPAMRATEPIPAR